MICFLVAGTLFMSGTWNNHSNTHSFPVAVSAFSKVEGRDQLNVIFEGDTYRFDIPEEMTEKTTTELLIDCEKQANQ